MRWVDEILVGFYALTLLVMGLVILGITMGFIPASLAEFWLSRIQGDPLTRWQFLAGGALMTLLALATVALVRQRSHIERHLVFRNEEGQIEVSIHALEEVVRNAGRDFLDIKSIQPVLLIHKNSAVVKADLELYAGAHINFTAERLQSRIKDQFEQLLGRDVKVAIDVVVRHVDRKGTSPRPRDADRSMHFGSTPGTG
ncbi:MAG: alkaline shock response membrane anchor protein AmaP [Candidatus Omnitrophica bacterium]|nr:alkaline shock response membrane anchor protein AmaP [Candidatus Omnitrophota bacterium]